MQAHLDPIALQAKCRRVLHRHGFRLAKLHARAPDPLSGHYVIIWRDLKHAIAVLDLEGVVQWVDGLKKAQRGR